MKVRIKTWDHMIEEFGKDILDCPDILYGFTEDMEGSLPYDRIIEVYRNPYPETRAADFVWPDVCTDREWSISHEMITEYINDDFTSDGFISGEIEHQEQYDKVARFEVIDGKSGRIVVRNGVKIRESLQDDGRTLKIFIEKREE